MMDSILKGEAPMDDLTATRLCAEAMGFDWKLMDSPDFPAWISIPENYLPLKDDAQAMALVKRFTLSIDAEIADGNGYGVSNSAPGIYYEHTDLNRAIVYCVAKMQIATIREGSHGQLERNDG